MPASCNAVRRQRFGILLTLVLIATATAISYFGTRDRWSVPGHALSAPVLESSTITAVAVQDLNLPQGPHREEFQTSCLICHSARLPFGQPEFRQEKWAEIVHKMVAVYGAPMNADEEAQVVQYLLAVRPQPP